MYTREGGWGDLEKQNKLGNLLRMQNVMEGVAEGDIHMHRTSKRSRFPRL
jgi:hypothetical protein